MPLPSHVTTCWTSSERTCRRIGRHSSLPQSARLNARHPPHGRQSLDFAGPPAFHPSPASRSDPTRTRSCTRPRSGVAGTVDPRARSRKNTDVAEGLAFSRSPGAQARSARKPSFSLAARDYSGWRDGASSRLLLAWREGSRSRPPRGPQPLMWRAAADRGHSQTTSPLRGSSRLGILEETGVPVWRSGCTSARGYLRCC